VSRLTAIELAARLGIPQGATSTLRLTADVLTSTKCASAAALGQRPSDRRRPVPGPTRRLTDAYVALVGTDFVVVPLRLG
jgi:hypothetical protein